MNYQEKYSASHQHPLNRALHAIGIPMIVVSLPLFFWHWQFALGLFVTGWIIQFIGHMVEGKPPAFFSNPLHLISGPVWWVRKVFKRR